MTFNIKVLNNVMDIAVLGEYTPITATIRNLQGKILITKQISKNNPNILLDKLRSGVYVIQLCRDEEIYSQLFIK